MLIFGGATVFFCQLYCILYMILSMEEHVGPVEVGSLSHYWQGFMHSKCLAGFLPSTIWLLTAIAIVWCLERLCWTQKSWTYLAEVPTPSSPKHHCLPSFFLFSLHFFSPEHERFLNLKITRFQRTIWIQNVFLPGFMIQWTMSIVQDHLDLRKLIFHFTWSPSKLTIML